MIKVIDVTASGLTARDSDDLRRKLRESCSGDAVNDQALTVRVSRVAMLFLRARGLVEHVRVKIVRERPGDRLVGVHVDCGAVQA